MNPEALALSDDAPHKGSDLRRRMADAWCGFVAGLGLARQEPTSPKGFTPAPSDQGGACGAARDCRRCEEDFDKALRQVEAASQAKSRFIATVSHELRTPLNAIIGFSQIIRDDARNGVSSPLHADFAQEVYESGVHLMEIINHMLELANMENGRRPQSPEEVDLRTILTFCVRDVEKKAAAAGVSLTLAPLHEDQTLIIDRSMLRQTLAHLLDNAIKFTPRGGKVDVTASIGDDAVAVTVRDTGVGMTAEDLVRAFQPFWQAAPTISRDYDGAGLGLTLAKKAVDLMNGDIALTSEPGRGVAARIVLPLRPAANDGSVATA